MQRKLARHFSGGIIGDEMMEEKIFSKTTCPYGFKRPYCEEVCVDFRNCTKDFYGKHEIVGLVAGFFKCSCGYSTESPTQMRKHQSAPNKI